jgi:hypothetical protein
MVRTGAALSVTFEVTQPRFVCYSSDMVFLEKRETRQISLSVRGLKARGPAESSNLINERVHYAQIADVDLESTPEGFQITITTDQLQVKFFVAEEWRAQNAVDSLRAGLISSIDTERVGAVWIEYRDQSQSG